MSGVLVFTDTASSSHLYGNATSWNVTEEALTIIQVEESGKVLILGRYPAGKWNCVRRVES